MVSIIIPVLNDSAHLRTLLERLKSEPGDLEILVADGGSHDIDRLRADFAAIGWVSSLPGRGRQMNAAARIARGEVFLFLHCDTCPPQGSIRTLPDLLDANNADFGAFQIRFDPPVWLPQLLARATKIASPWCCFGDQAIFVRRDFFFASGGFPEIPLLEDAHWVRRAGKRGRMVRSPYAVVSSARRFQRIGTVRQSLRNLTILLRDLAGQDPAELAVLYERGYASSQKPRPAPLSSKQRISNA